MDITPEPRRSAQRDLHDLLQAELLHTIGSYGVVSQRLDDLRVGIEDPLLRTTEWDQTLGEVVDVSLAYNKKLRSLGQLPMHLRQGESSKLLKADGVRSPPRHPHPGDYQSSQETAQWVVNLHATTVHALETARPLSDDQIRESADAMERLAWHLRQINDPQRSQSVAVGGGSIGRLERNRKRYRDAADVLGIEGAPVQAETILYDYLGAPGESALHLHVLRAFTHAHVCMHRAENYLSHAYGVKVRHREKISEAFRRELEQSLVLNTFVYALCRSAPWIFAEDEAEGIYVREHVKDCRANLTPTFCMWIGFEMSMLALHRRAFTLWLLGESDRAYRDFYKLVRFLRGARPRLERRATRAPGARTFLEGLGAIAEQHTGRIYRNQHAHAVALRYFRRAARRLEPWQSDPEIAPLLHNSRWRVHLLISQGKAYYELGQIKRSLWSYMLAWRAFMELSATESRARPNFGVVDDVIGWLRRVQDDPEVDKDELRHHLAPFVEQVETVFSPAHLRLLAADIMMRLGHVLYILKVPGEDARRKSDRPPYDEEPDHELARRCLTQAARLDRSSTLIASDLRKIVYASAVEDPPELEDMVPLGEQWVAAGGRFEESARVIEYVLQTVLAEERTAEQGGGGDQNVARHLLWAFLTHTDSSNVKLAQVYRYLMQESRTPKALPKGGEGSSPVVDLVCLRRYSSFFPFLPRPSTFQAPGGGYFVQVHDPEPFGIAIDPGPNFLDNLYRCGYCLDDVHMVIVTHDHADHMSSLDPLLSLLQYRLHLRPEGFSKDRRLIIAGNPSVFRRYSFFNEEEDPDRPGERPPLKVDYDGRPLELAARTRDFVSVMGFDRLHDLTVRQTQDPDAARNARVRFDARSLIIEPVETFAHRDAHGTVAQGFMITVGRGDAAATRILFTSDTGPVTAEGAEMSPRSFGRSLKTAVEEADVVVAHLSTVPLDQLRNMADLDEAVTEHPLAREFHGYWNAARERTYVQEDASAAQKQAAERARFLLAQLQFGFRVRPSKKLKAAGEELAVSPLSRTGDMRAQSEKHLFLNGVMEIAGILRDRRSRQLLIVGELREELGTFRTRIAREINSHVFDRGEDRTAWALTADIGLKIRLDSSESVAERKRILCTTCDLDNDLVDIERYHHPRDIREVCVKGEHEAVFYNCGFHDPQTQDPPAWLEAVERYDPFAV
jgi:ribonuclease BN (tRNA processing enzyme)/tetratricopeptide (TPR) repeat protein/mRNA-degrading endonuclease YafQ of YafQ-DinJ toxin-antitoxin module